MKWRTSRKKKKVEAEKQIAEAITEREEAQIKLQESRAKKATEDLTVVEPLQQTRREMLQKNHVTEQLIYLLRQDRLCMPILNGVNNILIQLVFWVSVGFVVGVSFIWPWWKEDFGWTIVLKTAAIAMLLFPAQLIKWGLISRPSLPLLWFQTGVFAMVAVIIVWRFIVIWVIQKYDPPPTKSGRKEFRSARARWKAIRKTSSRK